MDDGDVALLCGLLASNDAEAELANGVLACCSVALLLVLRWKEWGKCSCVLGLVATGWFFSPSAEKNEMVL